MKVITKIYCWKATIIPTLVICQSLTGISGQNNYSEWNIDVSIYMNRTAVAFKKQLGTAKLTC